MRLQAGFGVFVAPSLLRSELRSQYDLVAVGEAPDVSAEYFAIPVERRLTHPCVLAITQSARDWIFQGDTA